jgi:hypothetical protein
MSKRKLAGKAGEQRQPGGRNRLDGAKNYDSDNISHPLDAPGRACEGECSTAALLDIVASLAGLNFFVQGLAEQA